MILWTLTYFSLFLGLAELKPLVFRLRIYFSENRAISALREAVYHLKLLREMLETGNVPEHDAWAKIETFPKPWDEIVSASIRDLRAEGAPILPTLFRIQKTLEDQVEFILEARTKSSQAFGQAFLGVILIPVFGIALYWMLPGIQESTRSFFLLTLFSLLLSASAFVWMIAMVEQARFGNLKSENRRWLITVNATLERVLALISTGTPPDIAWKKSMEELSRFDESLVAVWKLQVWDPDFKIPVSVVNESERLILGLGLEVRKSIQTSLLEGRPCLDRIESVHRAFQVDLRALISRELNLLPNRCLKPLFIFVLPAIMILMGGSFALSFQQYF